MSRVSFIPLSEVATVEALPRRKGDKSSQLALFMCHFRTLNHAQRAKMARRVISGRKTRKSKEGK